MLIILTLGGLFSAGFFFVAITFSFAGDLATAFAFFTFSAAAFFAGLFLGFKALLGAFFLSSVVFLALTAAVTFGFFGFSFSASFALTTRNLPLRLEPALKPTSHAEKI